MGDSYKAKRVFKKNPIISARLANIPFTSVRQCSNCGKWFNHQERPRTTCSEKCFMHTKTVKNAGIHKHQYKNITLDSGWEVKLAEYLDKNNIEWERPTEPLYWTDSRGKRRRYFPDFYLPKFNIYLDPKNPLAIKKQYEKVTYFSKFPNIIIGDLGLLLARLTGLEPA